MCGIIGYIGNKPVERELLAGLKKLEYRGYDSAGMVVCDGDFTTTKAIGCINNLEKIVVEKTNATIGIAHTRWATHGGISANNTHPHISNDNSWAIVHNGIIENYLELKKELIDKGFHYYGETDSEVIPNLCEYYYNEDKLQSFIAACNHLKGGFAIACINKEDLNTIYLAKNQISLYVACSDESVYVASDPSCFVGKADKYYSLENGEYCKASVGRISFYDKNGSVVDKESVKIDNVVDFSELGDYPHYMIKEIEETDFVLKKIYNVYTKENVLKKITNELLHSTKKIVIIGCGTAYHSGLIGEKYIESLCGIDTECYIASEYRYLSQDIKDGTLFIFISQSGETADTVACLNLAKEHNCKCIALTNVAYSTIAKNADIVLPVCAGPEIAVASTKAYSAQVLCLYILAKYMCSLNSNKLIDYSNVENFINASNEFSDMVIDSVVNYIINAKNIVFIGRNYDYITATEANLKLKEITYINSSAYPAGELKHGYIALVDNETIVFVIATELRLLEKTLNAAFEAKARGAKIIFVSQFDCPCDEFIYIRLKKTDELFMPIVTIKFFQKLSYRVSISKGINPDKPRNLAKSVTVE